jgi:hypothetical protein
VVYLDNRKKLLHLKPKIGLSRRTKEAEQPKKAPPMKSNTPK